MSTRVFDLEGRVGLQDKDFLSKVKRIREANKSLRREMQLKAGTLRPTKEYQALEKQIRASEKALEDLNKEKAKQAKSHTQSAEYKALQKDIATAEAELDGLIEKQISMADLPHGAYFQQLDDQIEQARVRLEEMKASLAAIAETGATDKEAQDWYRTASAIDQAEGEIRQYKAQRDRMEASGTAYEKTGPSAFKRIRTAIASATKQLLKMTPLQKRVSKGFSNIGKQANKMKRGLMMGMGVRGLVRLGAAGAIALYSVRMLKQGMENLVNYDATTMNSLNMLKASLDTLRNALATAFAPIFNAIAPALNTLISMLAKAATAVAHFMAAITGQKSVIVAKKAVSGYSGAAAGAAKNSKKANKAAKEYQSTLLGFDQINKLESNKGSDAGGAGGAGGGGGGGGLGGGMFETVPVDSNISRFVDRLKKAWEKADFYWLGKLLANKINAAMEKIPWGKINKTAWKIAHSIGTFINGFIENFNWKLLGRTISNGILVAFNFLSTFIETINWQAIGKAIVDFIMGIRWGALIKASARLVGNAAGALAGVLWGMVKTAGAAAVKKIKAHFGKAYKDAGKSVILGFLLGVGRAIVGIPRWIIKNVFKPFFKGFKKAFGISSPSKKMKPLGKDIMLGLLNGVKEKLANIIDWFKKLPGKIIKGMGKAGEIALDFTANLIGDGWDKIKNITGKTLEYAAKKIGTVWDTLTATVCGVASYVAEKAGKVWAALNDTVSGVASYVAEKAGKVWAALNDTVSGIAKYIAKKAGGGWKKLTKTLKGRVNYYAKKAGSGWRKLTKKLKATVSFTAKWAAGAGSWLKRKARSWFGGDKAEGGVYSRGRWKPVQQYEAGGMPNQGQMFIARERGPELVGTLGGNTAVMNNDQIVASVSAGVAKAVAAVLGDQAQDVNIYLQGDAGQIFKVVRKEAKNYTMSTGLSAFPV